MFPRAAEAPAVGSATMAADPAEEYCASYQQAIELLGRRWTGEIVRALLAGKTRFREFTAIIPGLSDRLCSERLKDLEAEGIVQRCVSPETPVRVDYRLTEKGQALGDVVDAVVAWANRWVSAGSG
jgi:DNA-binding HxlR family transcriptional regulator